MIIFEIFSFALFTPPLGDFQAASRNSLLTGLIHGGGSLSAIRSTRARIETAVARIAAEVVGGEMRWRSDPVQALYHCELPSVHLTVNVWAPFSLRFI